MGIESAKVCALPTKISRPIMAHPADSRLHGRDSALKYPNALRLGRSGRAEAKKSCLRKNLDAWACGFWTSGPSLTRRGKDPGGEADAGQPKPAIGRAPPSPIAQLAALKEVALME